MNVVKDINLTQCKPQTPFSAASGEALAPTGNDPSSLKYKSGGNPVAVHIFFYWRLSTNLVVLPHSTIT